MSSEIPNILRNLFGGRTDGPAQVSNPNESEGRITPEIARQDIKMVMEIYNTLGDGSDIDRAAQIVLLANCKIASSNFVHNGGL